MNAPGVVWNELGPPDHVCQFYESDDVLIAAVDSFIGSGLEVGDAAIVIATPAHLQALNARLSARGLDLRELIADDQYVPLPAAETLAKFMNKGWPDQMNFIEVIRDVMTRATKKNRRVRAFGEMVALLWAEGNRTATIRLEKLWNDLAKTEAFTLFCAYPKASFNTCDSHAALRDICAAHSQIIPTGT